MVAKGILSDEPRYQFDSFNAAQEYGKALYLGIDTNPDMPVAEISEKLCKIAAEFAPQDIKYNVYTPQYLLENYCYNLDQNQQYGKCVLVALRILDSEIQGVNIYYLR